MPPNPPARRQPNRRWLWVVLLLLALAGLAFWLIPGSGKQAGKDHKSQPAPVAVAPAVRKDIPVYLNGLGTVQAYNTVTVRSQVDGQLIEVAFREGQDVHKGDLLAKIDPRVFQAQLEQALGTKAKDQALLENARRDLTRYVNLGNSISAQTVDTQRATVHQLEATVQADQGAVDNARTQLSYTAIASPIDGRTGIRQVDVGNIVHSADANGVVVITQLQPISVLFSLPQQNLQAINRQTAAQGKLKVAALDADNRTPLDEGVLELVDNQIDQATGTIKLKATFPNAQRMLWPGGFANVRMLLTVENQALTVPTAAVQRGPQGPYVFLLQPDQTVKMQPVSVGISEGEDSVIEKGLSDGDQVVTDGMAKLQDGSKVTLADEAQKEPKEESGKEKPHKHGGKAAQ
ncbi:MAG: MdtA/MuxA family multidrug efflux RND transporter periplasmic adaptor subunit [Alphaproteobacteria bacterium]|nr:MdtA/MuxA family multidrug efflux RND transporter periplasmic adaptor subunit [Alphaproteobacteria bacterium]